METTKETQSQTSQEVTPNTQSSSPAETKPVVMSSAALLKREASNNNLDTGPQMVNDAKFTKLYFTPEKVCYMKSGLSKSGLKIAKFIDLPDFLKTVLGNFDGKIFSYSTNYKGRVYYTEVTKTITGWQYCIQKMPVTIPNLEKLGFTLSVNKILQSLGDKSGLIVITGATSSGKTTTAASLLKKYIQNEGGYAITVENPIELPLDGVYNTKRGDLGICKQTTSEENNIVETIKQALRSKPRYLYLNELTSPEVTKELLKAATSGCLVITTLKANSVNDALKILAHYITSSSVGEEMGYNLLANGLLACVYQELKGTPKHLRAEYLFANPDITASCQVRGLLRSGNVNATTQLEQQKGKIERGQPLF